MKTLYASILDSLKQGNDLVEVTIIEQHGSVPRTAGAKMLVMQSSDISDLDVKDLGNTVPIANGISIKGTVGGGLYEAKAIDLARTFFTSQNSSSKQILGQQALNQQTFRASIVYFDLRGGNFPTDMDMVCGGELRLLVEYISATKETITLYEALVQAETSGQACTLVTRVQKEANLTAQNMQYEVHTEKALIFTDTLNPMNLNTQIVPDAVNTHIKMYSDENSRASIKDSKNKNMINLILDEYEYIFENLHKPFTIHIFGAGHVSCELAKITHYLDFKTIVLDDRAEFSNKDRFPQTIALVLASLDQEVITSYLSHHKPDFHDGIVIVTRGHANDRDVLAAALQTNAGYIGMIGSKSKRQTTYDFLLNNGYTKEDFARIHSPIGLSIGAQTPQEIAISISAQLIQWKHGHI